ncbi:MAG: flagella biosynthesis chaperone for FliD, FliT [Shewanella sp.]
MTSQQSALAQVNQDVAATLAALANTPAEDVNSDDLVSKLQELSLQRQNILDVLLADETLTDVSFWQEQWQLTQTFSQGAIEARDHRQSLLHAGRQTTRHINMYQSIDDNR